MRRTIITIALVILILAIGSRCQGAVISGTAPAFADSGGTCTLPRLVPRSGPMTILVEWEGPRPSTAVVRRDSISVQMGAPFMLTTPTPNPSPGTYIIRVRGRRASSTYGCPVTATLTILDILPPAKALINVR